MSDAMIKVMPNMAEVIMTNKCFDMVRISEDENRSLSYGKSPKRYKDDLGTSLFTRYNNASDCHQCFGVIKGVVLHYGWIKANTLQLLTHPIWSQISQEYRDFLFVNIMDSFSLRITVARERAEAFLFLLRRVRPDILQELRSLGLIF